MRWSKNSATIVIAIYCALYPLVRGLILGKNPLISETTHRVEWLVASSLWLPAAAIDSLVTGRQFPSMYPGLPP